MGQFRSKTIAYTYVRSGKMVKHPQFKLSQNSIKNYGVQQAPSGGHACLCFGLIL